MLKKMDCLKWLGVTGTCSVWIDELCFVSDYRMLLHCLDRVFELAFSRNVALSFLYCDYGTRHETVF